MIKDACCLVLLIQSNSLVPLHSKRPFQSSGRLWQSCAIIWRARHLRWYHNASQRRRAGFGECCHFSKSKGGRTCPSPMKKKGSSSTSSQLFRRLLNVLLSFPTSAWSPDGISTRRSPIATFAQSFRNQSSTVTLRVLWTRARSGSLGPVSCPKGSYLLACMYKEHSCAHVVILVVCTRSIHVYTKSS
ncbi:hypothetical protein HDK64DRAFT_262611 [Phyllosticta capitalensis]